MNKIPVASDSVNILSFDIEEWFMLHDTSVFPPGIWKSFTPRLEYNTLRILELLNKTGTKGVFYILGWVAEHYPALVYEIALAGHEIGYHSYYHHNNDMLGPAAFEADLQRGLSLLEKITGRRPVLYRSPNFSMHAGNLWVVPILMRNGIKINSSIRRLKRPDGSLFPAKPFKWQAGGESLWEFPLAGARVGGLSVHYAGSGHFRLLPDALIHHFTGRSAYNMYYFHPRDFEDHPQRSPRLSALRNFKNSLRTRSALSRLEKLITRHPFIPFSEALERIRDFETISLD